MTRKPRKRSPREPFRLENVIIDDGEYGPDVPAIETRKGGSPPIHDWSRIEPVIDWYLANRKLVLEADFVEAVRGWCRQEKQPVPAPRTILKRLQERAKLPPELRPVTPSYAQ